MMSCHILNRPVAVCAVGVSSRWQPPCPFKPDVADVCRLLNWKNMASKLLKLILGWELPLDYIGQVSIILFSWSTSKWHDTNTANGPMITICRVIGYSKARCFTVFDRESFLSSSQGLWYSLHHCLCSRVFDTLLFVSSGSKIRCITSRVIEVLSLNKSPAQKDVEQNSKWADVCLLIQGFTMTS